ncbi:MAG TPA: hypothetical protein PK624_14270 [Spirochaetota bacterium]|nr:hypothetical protein [Spirochaetota bacterium]HOR45951.1 hypothetical protein [Spirochaetota bacterium]HOR45956.1 hypothetical protein [Spirochaetota bacterium]HOU85680.1 hypothetical protein [Spirochaetota bacterium]HPK56604.1 hypothetical protein [Spirochaetota bacterium]
MSFVKIEGVKGMVFVPDSASPRKNNCPDCFSCQFCPDERCEVCIKRRNCKTSLARTDKCDES